MGWRSQHREADIGSIAGSKSPLPYGIGTGLRSAACSKRDGRSDGSWRCCYDNYIEAAFTTGSLENENEAG
jgi:hypothetical protein